MYIYRDANLAIYVIDRFSSDGSGIEVGKSSNTRLLSHFETFGGGFCLTGSGGFFLSFMLP